MTDAHPPTATTPNALLDTLWRFLRGDMTTSEFEGWTYETPALEALLGPDLYLAVVSTFFSNPEEVDKTRDILERFAREQTDMRCECITLRSLDVVDMGHHEHIFKTLDKLASRGPQYWWLSIEVCRECTQPWLIASEERQNDVFCMRRLSTEEHALFLESGTWPSDFDSYGRLLEIGREAGRSVRWVAPLEAGSVRETIADLAKERPGIGLSELCSLLNLDAQTITTIVEDISDDRNIRVDLQK
ncbi:MAG: hypothetical protein DRJ42_23760 [Deltaproteobacteria bacterium]|nr:MAG: hypothetical protein DRJ42_23760 [Deltaproteobacteria bacterium]